MHLASWPSLRLVGIVYVTIYEFAETKPSMIMSSLPPAVEGLHRDHD